MPKTYDKEAILTAYMTGESLSEIVKKHRCDKSYPSKLVNRAGLNRDPVFQKRNLRTGRPWGSNADRNLAISFARTIEAKQRFAIGQRVEFSELAKSMRVARGDLKGAIIKMGTELIVIKFDDGKLKSFHHMHFNPVDGPKAF